MPDLDEFDVARPLQGSNHTIDSVARISVDPADSPVVQAFNHEIADFHSALHAYIARSTGCRWCSKPGSSTRLSSPLAMSKRVWAAG
jgi:hypothetical protein